MRQDLCRPERTHRGLSLAFIRCREKEGGGEVEKKTTLGEERQKQREGKGGWTESMLSIKQEGLCSLKLVRA